MPLSLSREYLESRVLISINFSWASSIRQNHDGEVYLYSFTRTAEGAPMLSNIESDEEYNKAAIAFDTVLQNAREAEAAGTPLE